MQRQATNIATIVCFAVLLFFGACRTKKQIISTKAVAVDTATAFVPIDTTHFKTERQIYIPPTKNTLDYYNDAYNEIEKMLNGYRTLDFKRAVFVTENAYFKEKLDYKKFEQAIIIRAKICEDWIRANPLKDYKFSDSIKFHKNFAIYKLLKDTIYFTETVPLHYAYNYDFEDFFGKNDWTKMFVSKLLETGSGNCHSLPYLYKIIANELNTEAYLSLAPNHIYIKNRSKKLGWYNTELTSGEFPTDAWIKASGYISIESIKSGIYMDTLGQIQSIALCAYDLAKGYLIQTQNSFDGFALKCCDLVLQHYPNNINAIILKAEILRKIYEIEIKNGNKENASKVFNEMQGLYSLGLNLGYREMPKEMYLAWLKSVKEQKEKYTNQEIYNNFNTSNK